MLASRLDRRQRFAEEVWDVARVEKLYAMIDKYLDEEKGEILGAIERLGREHGEASWQEVLKAVREEH